MSDFLRVNPDSASNANGVAIAPQAVVIVTAGMIAAWFSAGSTGLLIHPLEHALTWLALGVAIVTAWPQDNRRINWAVLAIGAGVGLFLTASSLQNANILAVVVVLAAVAQVTRGLTSRAALIVAMAAETLALYRFACDSIPTVWLAADLKGWVLGRLIGWLVGCPLQVGSTFAGLDFLVVMTVIYFGWLLCTASPRCPAAIWLAVAIVFSHLVYLALLAYSGELLAALPPMAYPAASETSRLGLWTLGNGMRMLLPWNVPLLAVLLNCVIVVVMFRSAVWLPVVELDPEQARRQLQKEEQKDVPDSEVVTDMLFRFGPAPLAVIVVLLVGFGSTSSDLRGKTIVAYDRGYLNWLKPEYDSKADGLFGMLPVFVESLGGKFVHSKDLSEQDLAQADVLLLIHPDEPWTDETLERVWDYVRRGGSLLLAADPVIAEGKSRSHFNDVLQPTAMQVRNDTAVTRTGGWEQSYQVLSHPATAGVDDSRNRFGFELGSSIRTCWPARPVVVGRWGWSDPGSDTAATGVSSYDAGELLGDLVLAAEQSFGAGRIFVLGGVSPLRNEMLANSYPFIGRLFGYLANRPSSPQTLWRQFFGLAALLVLFGLLALRPTAWQLMLTPTVMAATLICCTSVSSWSSRVLPDGRIHGLDSLNNVAYVDASHMEAFSSDLWTNTPHGISGLLRTLMRHGYLPLLAPDLSADRLQRAGILISIAPARGFSFQEREIIGNFVGAGGTFICLVGAEESRAIAPLLADFEFTVPPSPLGPNESGIEPEPLGVKYTRIGESDKRSRFHAAWPVECRSPEAIRQSVWSEGNAEFPIIINHSGHGGSVVVIGDTHFAANENLEASEESPDDRILYWRWLLSRVVVGQTPWDVPAEDRSTPTTKKDSDKTKKTGTTR